MPEGARVRFDRALSRPPATRASWSRIEPEEGSQPIRGGRMARTSRRQAQMLPRPRDTPASKAGPEPLTAVAVSGPARRTSEGEDRWRRPSGSQLLESGRHRLHLREDRPHPRHARRQGRPRRSTRPARRCRRRGGPRDEDGPLLPREHRRRAQERARPPSPSGAATRSTTSPCRTRRAGSTPRPACRRCATSTPTSATTWTTRTSASPSGASSSSGCPTSTCAPSRRRWTRLRRPRTCTVSTCSCRTRPSRSCCWPTATRACRTSSSSCWLAPAAPRRCASARCCSSTRRR